MSIINAIILGAIQGITEFLPISSSAHLVIIPLFLKQTYQGLTFDVALHLGTLLAIIFYFFKEWLLLVKNGLVSPHSQEGRLFWYIILASFPAAIAGFLLESIAETALREPIIIAIGLISGAIILWISDKKTQQEIGIKEIGIRECLFIGIAQSLAIIPGISRSGITIAAGLIIGLKRDSAAKFAFLLAVPIIFAAGLLIVTKLKITELNVVFFMGVLSSAVMGFLSIDFLLKYLKKANLNVFIIYRIILGLTIILLTLGRLI